jgi:hypothetical protein
VGHASLGAVTLTTVVLPIATGVPGLFGSGAIRFLLDLRQVFQRAQGPAPLVHDKLLNTAQRLDADIETEAPGLAFEPLPIVA